MSGSVAADFGVTAPIPVLTSRPRWRDVFATLRIRNFRMFVASLLAGSVASWISRVAVDWLVLELTGNVALVGLAVTLQFAPSLLLGAWAGVIADRYHRRNVLLVGQILSSAGFTVLAILVLLDAAELPLVYAVSLLLGISMAIDGPSRFALLPEIVGPVRLRLAMSLNSMTYHLGGFVGPALSGVLIAVAGTGWALAVAAGATGISMLAIGGIRTRELVVTAARAAPARGQIREAARYALGKPTIFWPMLLIAVIAAFGMTLPVLFASAASEDGYGTGAAGYGLYTALAAVGAFVGSLLAGRRRTLRLRSIVIGTVLFGLVLAGGGLTHWYVVFLGVAVGVGLTRLPVVLAAEAMVQFSTNPRIRGRIMSFYFVLIMGGQAGGGLLIGWIAETFGMMPAYAIAGGIPVLAATVVAILLARRHRLGVRVDLRSPRRLVRIVPRSAHPAG